MITNYKNKETGVFLSRYVIRERCALLVTSIPEDNSGVSIIYLSKTVNMEHCYVQAVLKKFKIAGIIKPPEKVGRKRMIVLTEKGLKLKKHLLGIFNA